MSQNPDPLAQLKAVYVEKLPDRIDEVAAAVSAYIAANSEDDGRARLEDVIFLTHKLAGSGASYGFPAISDTARVMQNGCVAVLEGGALHTHPDAQLQGNLTQWMAGLQSAAEVNGSASTEPNITEPGTAEPEAKTGAAAASDRVLIVDDDASLAHYAEIVLKKAGLEVAALTQSTEALARIAEFSPSVVLIDINMPELSGPQVAAAIRAHPDYANISILYISAEEDPERRQAALDAGGDGFIDKPLKAAELIAAVSDVLNESA